MSKPDGGPVFPRPEYRGNPNTRYNVVQVGDGMSLRDYFAATALTGLAPAIDKSASSFGMTGEKLSAGVSTLSVLAYMLADAMLAERAK